MPSVGEYLEDPLYANWVKSSLALNITNEVIRPFAVKEIKRLHQTIISPLADKGPCTSCTVDTKAGCRRGICSRIKSEIKNHHWFPNPSFVNTNIESWCTDSWEIAKCYMPKGEGYRNSSAADADLSASINVIMNCLHFQSFVMCDPSNPHDRYCKAREFRNTVMYSKSMKVSDDEMKENLDILIDILEEIARTCFKEDSDDAVTNIKKIKNNTVTITMEDILKVRKQAMGAMELTQACIEDGFEAIRKEIQEWKHAIRREIETVQGKSLIPNFVEGCQVSLRRMTLEHIMNQRPDHIKPDDWTVANFLSNLNLHREKNDLSARHRDMLFPASGTPVDIRDWDIFLYIFILKQLDHLHVPVENSVKSYVREVEDLRKKLVRNPESIEKSQLLDLCEHLSDGDFKRDMTQIFNKTTFIDVVHSNKILTAWCMDDETYRNTQVMPSVEEYLEDPLHADWVKSSLALNITNGVMRPFVVKEIKRLHQTIISALPDGASCTSCIVSRADDCPLGICSHIKREIMNQHWFPNPSFVNTSISSWCTEPWEIAKCYMPKGECYRNSSAADADFSTSINVIMNCRHFQSFGTCDPNLTENKYFKARNVRNTIMHSKSMRLSETNANLDILIDILKEISTPSFKDDVDRAIEEINQIKNNTLTITMKDILKAREQAMVAMELTQTYIEEGLRAIQKEIEEGKHAIRREIERVHRTSLIPNFVEGCQVSLRKMTLEHIMNQRPEDIKPEDWTVANFLSNLNLHGEKNDLSARHRNAIFPTSGTPDNIRDWDIFLYCFILTELELPVQIEKAVKCYVQEVVDLRETFCRDPESVKKSQLIDLCDYFLDDDLKKDVTEKFNKTNTCIDVVHSNNILMTWQKDDERYSNTPVRRNDYNAKKMEVIQCQLDTWQQELSHIEGLPSKKKKTHPFNIRTRIKVNLKGCNIQLQKEVEENFTVKNPKKNIAKANGGLDHFQKEFSLKDVNTEKGRTILEVTCSSIKQLVDFWDSCMDGRAAKALSYVRDSYRDYFECDTLDFEVILTKKEVKRCNNEIVGDVPPEPYDEVLLREVQGMVDTEQEETHEDETRDDETHKEESHATETRDKETHEEETHGGETHATKTRDEETHEEETLEQENHEKETHEEDTKVEDTFMDRIDAGIKATQDKTRGYETLRLGSYDEAIHEDETHEEDTKEEDTFVVRPDAGTKAIQGPPASSPKTKVKGGFVEIEADRLVNLVRQTLEDLEGGDVATMITYLDETIRHSKEINEKWFYECVRQFLRCVSEADRLVNLLRQILEDLEGDDVASMKTYLDDTIRHSKDNNEKMIYEYVRKFLLGVSEADRLVNFLRQILEDLEGVDVATMNSYLHDIIRHSKENNEKMFYDCVGRFLLGVTFKSGTSPNLIQQVTRGFTMIQRQPEFGDLVATKLEVIEKEQHEQSAIKPSTSGIPSFKQSAGKSAVLNEASRSWPIKPRTEMLGKYHEKDVYKKTTKRKMENPSDTETTSKYPTSNTSYDTDRSSSDLVKLKTDESGKSGF